VRNAMASVPASSHVMTVDRSAKGVKPLPFLKFKGPERDLVSEEPDRKQVLVTCGFARLLSARHTK
jgi:hypothetical protein